MTTTQNLKRDYFVPKLKFDDDGFPLVAPVLNGKDMIKGQSSEYCTGKHCLTGWASSLTGSYEASDRICIEMARLINKKSSSFAKLVANKGGIPVSTAKKIYQSSIVVEFNDHPETTPSEAARLFNQALENLGYNQNAKIR